MSTRIAFLPYGRITEEDTYIFDHVIPANWTRKETLYFLAGFRRPKLYFSNKNDHRYDPETMNLDKYWEINFGVREDCLIDEVVGK